MPLSEHEQRLLDQIERALYQEDPKFASTVRATDLRTHMRRRLRRAALVLALGFGLLLTGVVTQQYAVGIAGFVVMVGALLLAMTSWKRMGQPGQPDLHIAGGPERPRPDRTRPGGSRRVRPPSSGGSSGGMMGRLEERWKRRWEERGGDSR
ncbi:MAG: FIG017342: transmembrane protein [uncultured Frankineae bacterium]|uniref:FIG017342: transmembrane protein n=1 Tax=uncultured Frankineae bacterium TaxID=437475 RepID=A0A6J4L9J6_9ACTN|nr:MAG: FIG017342: transmembrane protein [uncultured Frankineae bacterium]